MSGAHASLEFARYFLSLVAAMYQCNLRIDRSPITKIDRMRQNCDWLSNGGDRRHRSSQSGKDIHETDKTVTILTLTKGIGIDGHYAKCRQ